MCHGSNDSTSYHTAPSAAPPHYLKGGYECKDVIKAALIGITDPWIAYCIGSAFAYLWRFTDKGGLSDLIKAQDYLNWAAEQQSINQHKEKK